MKCDCPAKLLKNVKVGEVEIDKYDVEGEKKREEEIYKSSFI